MVTQTQMALLEWFSQNQRPLPWRLNRDPYRVWISETMLQQTTTTAVIPFFERFINLFPTLEALAQAPEPKILQAWAGLGYYSRARNLKKAAGQLVAVGGFPRTFEKLLPFAGIGPYTARAIASQAFGESVGVLDGNVIRVLSRVHGQKWAWWENKTRNLMQKKADELVREVSANEMNQALMELGATICTPQSPTCLLCPLRNDCVAFRKNLIDSLPLTKPKRAREIWHWQASVMKKSGRILLAKNTTVPFLKGQWLLPGSAERLTSKPKSYHYRHSITHHDIFVTVATRLPKMKSNETKWVRTTEVSQYVPASLVQKALRASELAGATTAPQRRVQTSKRPKGKRT